MHGRVVARWETKGKDFLCLQQDDDGTYFYTGNGCGGTLDDKVTDDATAIAAMEFPWGHTKGVGAVTALREDRKSLNRVI